MCAHSELDENATRPEAEADFDQALSTMSPPSKLTAIPPRLKLFLWLHVEKGWTIGTYGSVAHLVQSRSGGQYICVFTLGSIGNFQRFTNCTNAVTAKWKGRRFLTASTCTESISYAHREVADFHTNKRSWCHTQCHIQK